MYEKGPSFLIDLAPLGSVRFEGAVGYVCLSLQDCLGQELDTVKRRKGGPKQ